MKRLICAVCFVLLCSCAFAQTQGSTALGYVYSFGINKTTIANGVVVGGGEYVITPTMAVYESYDAKHGCVIDRPVFLSVCTGRPYECQTVFASKENNLALLKLPEKLPCNMRIGTGRDIGNIGIATMGQMYNMMSIKNAYKAQVTGIDRAEKDGEWSCKFTGFKSSYGVQCDEGSVKTIFLCNLTSGKNAPLGSMVTSGKAFVGLFNYIYAFSSQYKAMNHGRVIIGMYALNETQARGIDFDNAPSSDSGEYKFEQFNKFDTVFNMRETGNYEGSAAILAELVKEMDCAMAWELLGDCYYEQMKDKEAAECFGRALELNKNQILSQIRLAQLKDEKIKALEQLSVKYPEETRCWNALFEEYYAKGDSANASKAAQNAFKISEDNAQSILNSVKALKLEGRQEDALKVGEALRAYMPNMYSLLDTLANIYLDKKEYDKALPIVSTMIENSPRSAMPYCYYGEILLAQGDKAEAKGYFETASGLIKGDKTFLDNWLKKCE